MAIEFNSTEAIGYNEETTVEEVLKSLQPFTMEDAEEEKNCDLCKHRENCAIIIYVNKLAKKKQRKNDEVVKSVSGEFYCAIYDSVNEI